MKRASVRIVPSIRHFESLTLWIQLSLGLRDRAWKVTNGHSRKLSMTIFMKFWSRDRYPICIHGSRPRCFICIGSCWYVSRGRAALGLSFCEHKRRNGQICPFSFEDIILSTMNPGRVISNHRDSSCVGSCQLSSLLVGFRRFQFGWSFDFNKSYSTSVNKVWCLQCGQMF